MLKIILSLFLLTAVTARGSRGRTYRACPEAEEISPCTCYGKTAAHMRCTDIDTVDMLEDIIQRSSVRYFASIEIVNSGLLYLPNALFNNLYIDTLKIKDSFLTTLFDKAPPENELRHLLLENTKIFRTLIWKLLQGMNSLKTIKVINSGIGHINKDFRKYVLSRKLQQVSFENTGQRKLPNNTFANLDQLTDLNLSGNRISNLERNWFPNPSVIKKINLNNNRIKSLSKEVFSNMALLQDILLKGNNLTTVSEDVFGETLPTRVNMDLTDNPLECNCGIYWMLKASKKGFTFKGTCVNGDEEKDLSKLTEHDFSCETKEKTH